MPVAKDATHVTTIATPPPVIMYYARDTRVAKKTGNLKRRELAKLLTKVAKKKGNTTPNRRVKMLIRATAAF